MYPFFKRLIDLFVSLIVLCILLPFMLPIVIILLLTGEHYVFYLQKRIGYKNRYFNIIKFATMLKNSPNMGTGLITIRKDPRLLPIGGFLRMTKINELPQILNVIKGDMSIVGPRPLVDKTFNAYPEAIRNKIYDSVPGITGIGSIIFRDEEDLLTNTKMDRTEYYEKVIAPYKGELEMWYNKNKSLRVDFWIIFLTAWSIINPDTKLPHKVFNGLPQKDLSDI
ncbi:sugar transferase [Niabella ginsenosidivorans]|uniref:Sugar transferase n=1 Tax=Niabella ginsenosidivorans TaxID=1176587 RepID=A0A1A9I0A1_9BACT|nr:sugar transferase [Niabella ginsenosidivorans]ANH80923.1 sugar transferase [Niabella ginsenosidivorans]